MGDVKNETECTIENPCEEAECQECCSHDEHDHFICIECGLEMEPSDFGDEDYGLDR